MAFLPYLMPSIAVGAALFVLFSNEKINLFNTYTLLIIAGTIKYIPFASRNSLNSMLQLSGEIEEAAIIQNIPWIKRMIHIIIPIQKSSIISGYLLPFMTYLREPSLFMLLCAQGFVLSITLDYFDEMGLYAFSSGINLILIITLLFFNTLVNKTTGASLDKGIGGEVIPKIELSHVTKRWKKIYAVGDLDVIIDDNAFVTLLGPSGWKKQRPCV